MSNCKNKEIKNVIYHENGHNASHCEKTFPYSLECLTIRMNNDKEQKTENTRQSDR